LSQELASNGYIVLTLDHPLGGFTLGADGEVLARGVDSIPLHYADHPYVSAVRDWAIDAAFVLRGLAARLRQGSSPLAALVIDTARVGMLGHSLGGAAALEACRSNLLFRACADMDGGPFGDVESRGVGKPFLVLLSQPDHRNRPPPRDSAEAAAREQFAQMGKERDSTWAAICAHDAREPCFVVKIRGTGHLSFSDAPFLAPSLLRDVGATLSPRRQYRLIADNLLEFFGHFLRGNALRLRPGLASVP
jgi:predicted dienelactone hydrolase